MKIPRIPKMYCYVPKCPVCKSKRTGRYVPRPLTEEDTTYMIRESLANGELVRVWPGFIVPVKNAYCEDCGHQWAVLLHTEWWPPEKVEEQITIRGTYPLYEAFCKENPKRTLPQRFIRFIKNSIGGKNGN